MTFNPVGSWMQLVSRRPRLWLFVLGFGLGSLLLVAPYPAIAQDREAWLPVTILYNSDVKGYVEPCG